MEAKGASTEELKQLLGSGRAKHGMFEGNMDDGELEIGQAAALINSIEPAAEIIREIVAEFQSAKNELISMLRKLAKSPCTKMQAMIMPSVFADNFPFWAIL